MALCPCGSSKTYKQCCQPFHEKAQLPQTAEELMRSRYSAFVKGELEYLKGTIIPTSLHDYDEKNIKEWSTQSEWKGLTVVKSKKGQINDDEGEVEFIAKFSFNGEDREHHEAAQFKKLNGQWYYDDGQVKGTTIRNENKIGRNDPCPCGSGKKYKKCCGK